jgi:hypothetical protein
MAGCKLTQSLENKACEYKVAGASQIFLANFYPMRIGKDAGDHNIAYEVDADGYISAIHLPANESFYEISGENGTLSWADTLLQSGNGGKYRQHTVNAVLSQYDMSVVDEGDALSLGKFIAIVIDKSNRIIVLGRTSGLTAPAGGFDYNSGAADADANGWTVILQGSSMELGPLVKDMSVITPIYA